jgi:hypothetical protein
MPKLVFYCMICLVRFFCNDRVMETIQNYHVYNAFVVEKIGEVCYFIRTI